MAYYEFLTDIILENKFDSLDQGQLIPLRIDGVKTYCGFASGNHGPRYYHSIETVRDMVQTFESIDQFLRWYFGLYAQNNGAIRWGEKTPNNVFCIKEILRMFPDAVFVNIVRDPRDVVVSLVDRRNADLPFGVWRWLCSVNAFLKAINEITTEEFDRVYCLKYEDLVRSPETQLKLFCNFIKEDFSPRMLEYYKFDDIEKPGDKKDFDRSGMEYAVSPITDENVGRYKSADAIFVKRIVAACIDQMQDFGYIVE